MKKLLALVCCSMASSAAFALPIAYEAFNYPLTPTNLVGHVTPDGFSWDQAGPTTGGTNVPSIMSGNLSYPGLAPAGGNSVHFGGVDSGGMAARFSLKSPITSGTVYYSFICKVTDITGLSTSGVFWAGFNNSSGPQAGLPSVVGTRVLARAVTGGFQFGLDKASGTATLFQWAPMTNTTSDTVFIVGSYTFQSSSSSDDFSLMWINPDSSTFGTATPPPYLLASTNGSDLSSSQIGSFCFFNRNAAEPHGIQADQLIIGTSWADVTPTNVPLAITSQPKNARVVVGGTATFSVSTFNATTFQWQHNGSSIAGATQNTLTVTNVQTSDAGSYTVTVGNGISTPLVSNPATLTVYPDIYPHLVPLWSLAPGSRPYLTTDSTSSPNERCFAYNALSNQVLLVSRTNTTFNGITNAAIYVLDGDSGADLYQMGNDPSIITGGVDINGFGTNLITLNYIDVAADGAVYACNVGDDKSNFKVYRWDSSGANAAGPTNVWLGDPSGQATPPRMGDCMAVRGSGADTQILLDDSSGKYGSLLYVNSGGSPINMSDWKYGSFSNAALGITGGRTLLFSANDNSFWEKHGSGTFNLVSFDTNTQSSSIVTNYPNLLSTPNQVGLTSDSNMLFAIDYASSSAVPDTLEQYDYTDPSNPLFVRSYNFPVNHQGNSNGYGRVVVNGDRVYALDANNGLVAYRIEPMLSIAAAGANVVLSWSALTPGYTLMSTPSLTSPSWTSVGTGTLAGNQYFVTNSATGSALFYRLQK